MTNRQGLLEPFLAKTIWRDWQRAPVAGDASARRYFRLTQGDQSVILMDDPSPSDKAATQFVKIAQHLTAKGFCAPHILAHDVRNGFMVLTDLGDQDFAKSIANTPKDEQLLYNCAADVLLELAKTDAPSGLARMTPDVGAAMIGIAGEFYSRTDIAPLQDALHNALAKFAATPDTLSLRDFHAENLIWRHEHRGTDRVGLLDFQDAFLAPAGYDLASLLRDARRDVSRDVVAFTIERYMEKSGTGPAFRTKIACLGVQRNLRILGIFARLARQDGKLRYLAFLPRVWSHILADLEDPALIKLKTAVLENIPTPTPTYCQRFVQ